MVFVSLLTRPIHILVRDIIMAAVVWLLIFGYPFGASESCPEHYSYPSPDVVF